MNNESLELIRSLIQIEVKEEIERLTKHVNQCIEEFDRTLTNELACNRYEIQHLDRIVCGYEADVGLVFRFNKLFKTVSELSNKVK